jgi:hypothetical protein
MPDKSFQLQIGTMQFSAQNVQLREGVMLDEVKLEGADLRYESAEGKPGQFSTGEMRFRVVVTEPNVNRALAASMPPDFAVRSLTVELFSGKARISGQYQKLGLPIPVTLEAAPRLENGIKVSLDVSGAKAIFGFPAALVETIEFLLNRELTLDLSSSPVPVYLDDVRCEPGRLVILGRARLSWPPALPATSSHPIQAPPTLSPTQS